MPVRGVPQSHARQVPAWHPACRLAPRLRCLAPPVAFVQVCSLVRGKWGGSDLRVMFGVVQGLAAGIDLGKGDAVGCHRMSASRRKLA